MSVRDRLLIPAVLLGNAVVQAILVIPDPTPQASLPFLLGAAVSAIAWLATYGVIVARYGTSAAWARDLREHGFRFTAWTVALAVVVFVALIPLGGVVGWVLIAATPYVPLAAMHGRANPVRANFRAIGRAPWGYIWRVVAFGAALLIVLLLVALNAFFVTGAPSACLGSLALGAYLWAVTASFGREFRRQ